MDGVALDGKPEWCKCEAKDLDGGRRGFSGLKRKRCQRGQTSGERGIRSTPYRRYVLPLDVVEEPHDDDNRTAGRKEESDKRRVRKGGACLASKPKIWQQPRLYCVHGAVAVVVVEF